MPGYNCHLIDNNHTKLKGLKILQGLELFTIFVAIKKFGM